MRVQVMSQTIMVVGPDPEGIGDALEAEGVVVRITDTVSASTLGDASR
mgnify:CR=1 FL=1